MVNKTQKQKINLWQRVGIFFYDNWHYTLLLIIFVAGVGLVSYTKLMKREGFPSVEIPVGVAQVVSLGSDAATIDQGYAAPIAEAARTSSQAKQITTASTNRGHPSQ